MPPSNSSVPMADTEPSRQPRDLDPGRLTAVILLILGVWAALSLNVVRAGFGIKGDEATYVAMALSVAHDGDLSYQREDLVRFWRLYRTGPEGIFLKRGTHVRLALRSSWPFVGVEQRPDSRADRLYFGKAFIYPVVAAPLVRLAGLNGLFLFHALLLSGVVFAAYLFLVARSPAREALLYALGFLGASITPLYAVWLTPEVFNFSLVFFAYFLWFYREVAPPASGRAGRLLRSTPADILAAVLLGLATFSKPLNLLLIGPPVAFLFWQRRLRAGMMVGLVFGAAVVGSFAANAVISGEFNYQGGDRKTFYGSFPFEHDAASFDNRGIEVATDELVVDEQPGSYEVWSLLRHNVGYFLVGRHFGFLPFYFPGLVGIVLCLGRRHTLRPWHFFIMATVVVTALGLLIWLPYQWSGGGGPAGNRYFLSVYATLLFLTPPLRSLLPALVAWGGGALFTAHILVNPFVAAKQPWLNTDQGVFRLLPVELTMVNDLPIRLNPTRSRVPYGRDPTLLLYFLDDNAHSPESTGIWVVGESRAEIIIRTGVPLSSLHLTLRSEVANTVTVRAGGPATTVRLEPGAPQTISVAPEAVYARRGWAFLLSVTSTEGFVPRLSGSETRDGRFLGVLIQLAASTLPTTGSSASGARDPAFGDGDALPHVARLMSAPAP